MKFYLLYFSVLLGSCSETKKSINSTGEQGHRIKYPLQIPRGFKYDSFDADQHHRMQTFTYADSSMIFFTTDLAKGIIYNQKFEKYGPDIWLEFVGNDTLTINGISSNGKFWEERKRKNIVYGYINVSRERKREFDKALDGIKYKSK